VYARAAEILVSPMPMPDPGRGQLVAEVTPGVARSCDALITQSSGIGCCAPRREVLVRLVEKPGVEETEYAPVVARPAAALPAKSEQLASTRSSTADWDDESFHLFVSALQEHQKALQANLAAHHAELRQGLDTRLSQLCEEMVEIRSMIETSAEHAKPVEWPRAHSKSSSKGGEAEAENLIAATFIESKQQKRSDPPQVQDSVKEVDSDEEFVIDNVLADVPQGPPTTLSGKAKAFIRGQTFDLYCGVSVCLNVLVMFVELEKDGYLLAAQLGLRSGGTTADDSAAIFSILEHVFNAIFVVEIALRFWAFGKK